MTSLDPKIIMREKGIETAKPIHPASWFRHTRLQIYYRRHVLERMTGYPEVNDGAFQLPDCRLGLSRWRGGRYAWGERKSWGS